MSLGDTLPEQIREHVLHQRVETAGGFVEDQQSRLMREGQYQTQLLPHAAGHLAHAKIHFQAKTFRQLASRGE